MRYLRCPSVDSLREYVSISSEIPLRKRLALKSHALLCSSCQREMEKIRGIWKAYFTPEPDVTSSLIRVFSRLQKDETLILKGWKLNSNQQSEARRAFLREGWLFRGAVSLGFGALAFILVSTGIQSNDEPPMTEVVNRSASMGMPTAQFRVEEKNSIRVHYVKPELLESMEFETTSPAR